MPAAILLTLLALFADVSMPTNIPAQDLGSALRTLAKERDFQIIYASQDVAGRQTSGAHGTLTNLEALQKLLAGTGMTYQLLDEHTVTLAIATRAPEPAQRRPTAPPPLPEVAISAERDERAALRARMIELNEEFFAEYNRLNSDDQFDIACQEDVCKPAFVDELEGAPIETLLAKSKDYEKNVLSLINRYPQLARIARAREALDARYGKPHRSKQGDETCADEPPGTFMRMTFAMTGFALCTGLYVSDDELTDEPLPEVEINARRESLTHLRREIVRLEEAFYAKYNQLNDDDQYDIQCSPVTPTGSLLKGRECEPLFVARATEARAQGFVGSYGVSPATSIILSKWPDFEKTLVKAIQTYPELQKLAEEHAVAEKRYAVVRKLKLKGKLFAFD